VSWESDAKPLWVNRSIQREVDLSSLGFESPVQSGLFAFLGKTETRTGPIGPWTSLGPVKTGLSKDRSITGLNWS